MQRKFSAALFIIGFSGMVAQIILIRELLVVFHGNELSLGIIIANWLISEASGAYFMGGLLKKIYKKFDIFIILQILFSISLLLSVLGVRTFKNILGFTTGEILSPWIILISSLFLIFLPSFIHGSLFSISCKLKENNKEPASSIGIVYVFETLGNIAAALCLNFVLLPHFHSIDIVLVTSILITSSCMFLIFRDIDFRIIKRSTKIISLTFFITFIISLLSPVSDFIHKISIDKQWQGQKIISYKNSIFGNIAITSLDEQITFYSNADPLFICPAPDTMSHEELAHIPLLYHPNPKNILVLSGGIGGFLSELSKYPVKIDNAEIDPAIIQTSIEIDNKFQLSPVHEELYNKKIKHHLIDGRLFITKTASYYDAIFINLDIPTQIQTNRLFTKEFMKKARSRLKNNGLFVLTLPGSLNYMSVELKKLNACIRNTLNSVFESVIVIPGTRNIYIASPSNLNKSMDVLLETLQKRNIKTHLITPFHISLKLDKTYQTWFENEMKNINVKINQDLTPIGTFYAQSYQNSFFSYGKENIFEKILSASYSKIIYSALLIFFIIFLLKFLSFNFHIKTSLSATIATTGFASMFFNMSSILIFQIYYGYVYYFISLLIAFFMCGVSIGAYFATKHIKNNVYIKNRIIRLQYGIIVLIIALFIFTLGFKKYDNVPVLHFLFRYVLLALNLIFGILQGYEFPTICKSFNFFTKRKDKTAGFLYACDLLGGFAGGILSTILLIPLYGLLRSCTIVVLIKVIIIFLLSRIKLDNFSQKNV